MGGGHNLSSHLSDDDGSSLDNDDPKFACRDGNEFSNGYSIKEDEEFVDKNLMMKRKIAYREILKRYDHLLGDEDKHKLCQAKNTILSYTPGSWITNGDGNKQSGYIIPKTTTLLVIGPRRSGKSSLINRISKLFEGDKFASERAQVPFNPSFGDGTHFLQECMIPRWSSSFCLFDTQSLSGTFAENDAMLLRWMRDGVRHRELAIRDSYSSCLKSALNYKSQLSDSPSSEVRKVNFVILVVNGASVLRAMNGNKEEDRRYMDTVVKIFQCPYLSFRDDKPVIVVTHGDLLSLEDRARVHVYLGEKLNVPPTKQIFDIPDNSDSSTQSSILDMLRYSLELADKNLPFKRPTLYPLKNTSSPNSANNQDCNGAGILLILMFLILLVTPLVSFIARSFDKSGESHINCEPQMESTSFSEPNHGANQFHENNRCEYQDSHVTSESTMNTKTDTDLSGPNLVLKSVASVSKSQELHGTPKLTVPTKLNPTTSTPTLNSDSVASVSKNETLEMPTKSDDDLSTPTSSSEDMSDGPSKHYKPRSASRKKRHTKPVTKWHKIRHVWAGPEDRKTGSVMEWSKIRHVWAAPED